MRLDAIQPLLAFVRSGTPARSFVMFLLITFTVEAAVMLALPVIIPVNAPQEFASFVDATILTTILAPIVWRVFIVPVRHLHETRGRLLEQVLSSQEEERRRIAHDLHDGLGQNLTTILMRLQVLEDSAADASARDNVAQLRAITAASLAEVRRVVRDTRPPSLDDLGLCAALEKQLSHVAEASGLRTMLDCRSATAVRLPTAVETMLFRVVQEAVTNVVRHAAATELLVVVATTDNEARAEVTDNGIGFDIRQQIQRRDRSFGLLGMHERATPLGGVVTVESRPGQGTRVTVTVPLPVPRLQRAPTGHA
jgi:signal transduction histidine kinase